MAQYHVTLNGQGYVLDLDRYAKRVRDPFVTKQSAGAVALGDLRGPEQLLAISDWSGGEGQIQHDEASPGRWRKGSGIDGFSVPGSLRLGPYVSTIGTTAADQVRVLQGFGTSLYAGCSGGLIYAWNGAAFTLVRTVTGTPLLVSMARYLGAIYYGNAINGSLGRFDGTTWNDAVTTAGGPIRMLMTHYRQAAQYLYVGARGAGAGGAGRVYFWDGSALSLGQFDTEEPFPEVPFVLNGLLYIAASENGAQTWALYSVDDSSSGGIWRRHTILQGRGFPGAGALHDEQGFLGDSVYPRIYAWDGSAMRVALDGVGLDYPFSGAVNALASWRGALWAGVVDADGTLALVRYDGASVCRPVTGLTGTAWRAGHVYGDRLYLGTQQTGAAKVMKVDPSLYGGSGWVQTGLIDFGLPGVSKLLRSVTIVTAAMPSGHSIQVEYQLEDTGSWTSLGTLSAVGATTATYAFAANVTCRQVAFRLTLTGSAGTSASPVLYELAVRYAPRPAITREWELAVMLEGTAELPLVTLDGAAESLTGAQLTQLLWTAAGSAGPVTLVDLDGVSYAVYVADVREELGKISQRRGYQRLGLVKLVEAA